MNTNKKEVKQLKRKLAKCRNKLKINIDNTLSLIKQVQRERSLRGESSSLEDNFSIKGIMSLLSEESLYVLKSKPFTIYLTNSNIGGMEGALLDVHQTEMGQIHYINNLLCDEGVRRRYLSEPTIPVFTYKPIVLNYLRLLHKKGYIIIKNIHCYEGGKGTRILGMSPKGGLSMYPFQQVNQQLLNQLTES